MLLECEIKEFKALKKEIKEKTAALKELKIYIIEIMEYDKMTSWETKEGNIRVSYPTSFDKDYCELKNNQEYNEFATTKVVEVKEFDKPGFKVKYPDLYNKYQTKLTPRLTVK